MDQINVEEWSEEEFRSSREKWTDLLNNSQSDRLFMSWEWLYSWWDVFSRPYEMKLRLLAATDGDGRLVGIAPLYLSVVTTRRFIKTRRLEFIGNRWRGPATMPTELQDFISDDSIDAQVIRALFAHIRDLRDWDEMIFPCLNKNTRTYRQLISDKPFPGCYNRIAEEFQSYYLDTTGSFTEYLQKLGKNTRLRLYNRRKLLAATSKVKYEVSGSENLDEDLELLNALHAKRWGRPVFKAERLEFNRRVANLLAKRGELAFSKLSVDGVLVSIQFNYVVGQHEYNIQAGFNPSIHKKIQLGYLHFGYAIERAFSGTTTTYDFLAGEGKNTQYKARLTDTWLDVVGMQVVRGLMARSLYKIYDRLHARC